MGLILSGSVVVMKRSAENVILWREALGTCALREIMAGNGALDDMPSIGGRR